MVEQAFQSTILYLQSTIYDFLLASSLLVWYNSLVDVERQFLWKSMII